MAQVNRPTNVRQKEEDVNQKLQLYGIYSGMSLDFPGFCVVVWRVATIIIQLVSS